MEGDMKFRRKLALLSSCAYVLQSLAATLPAQAFEDQNDMAAFFYWKLPLGGSPHRDVEPTFGFSVGQTNNGWLFSPPASTQSYTDNVVLPPLVDLHFGGGEDALPSLSLSGVDVVPVINGQLYAIDQPGSEWSMGEWIAAGVGAVAVGLGACAAAGCFASDHHGGGGEGGEIGG
jgi:hypothetical protein